MTGIPTPEGGAEAIRRPRLSAEVARRIEGLIHAGQYAAGDQLPSERDLMRQFGVGRPAVREALYALQTMGLVAVSSGERARVTRPTPDTVVESLSGAARHLLAAPDGIRHFQHARLFFEIGLARYAAEHATPEDVRALGEALEANRQALGDIAAFERTDVAFHYVLALIPRNPIFTAIHAAMVAWLTEQRTITLVLPGQKFTAAKAHERIFAAVVARDPEAAERAIRDHLDQVSATYWAIKRDAIEEGGHGGLRGDGGLPAEAGNV